ncbi:von Willebrand factor type A domain protein [Planctomycetes bacterium Poly30]|uniref:von Willebrand factor type A domain protein n=1 Tax=Saltatorellus ferox TaxID=2528018 RepID=A0A518EPN5_9BACT|nr:von Willebrand factor type A domain protein [Planctomycetes bacterium Poly30]
MDFQAPACLLFALFAVVPWLRERRLTRAESRYDRTHAALRSLAILAVALAMARPVRIDAVETRSLAILWDRSASVSAAADEAAGALVQAWLEEAETLDPAPRLTLLEIQPGPEVTRPVLLSEVDLDRVVIPAAERTDETTPIAAGLEAALRAGGGRSSHRVRVLSDGLGTDSALASGESLASAATIARESQIVIDWVRLPAVVGDLRVTGLRPVEALHAGLTGRIEVALEGGGQVIDVVLRVQGSEVARADAVRVDGPSRVLLSYEPSRAGFLEATVEAAVVEGVDPRDGGDLRFSATLPVQPARSALYFGDRMAGGADRLSELVGPGFEIQDAADLLGSDGPEGPGASVESALASTDLVIVDDRPATALPARLQEAIVRAVQDDGVGLLMAGGEAAFGPGGYHDQPLEEILPVEFVQKEEKRDPSTTLVVIIDTSGSMGGNRVQLAKEVARLAIRRLLPHDKVGLVEFYGAKRWAVPIQPASNSIEIERALNRLDAGGGTVILPAIEEAYYGLKNVRTRYKHVLILTDGGVETGSFEPLLRRMADDGMTVSTVLIGPDAHSEFLVNIANWGQGRFYSVPNRFSLPEILLKQPASAKLPAYRPGETAVVSPTIAPAWWGELDPVEGVPALDGYVETRLRGGAASVLETAEERHPVVASWRHGLGRVTAMTTEPTGPGTESWRSWSGYGAFLSRVLERTASDISAPFVFQLVAGEEGALLVAERRTSNEADRPSAELIRADLLDSDPIEWERVAPDRYEARLVFHGADDSIRVAASSGAVGQRQRPATFLTLDARSVRLPELQVPTDSAAALDSLVRWSGGHVVAPGEPAATSALASIDSALDRQVQLRELSPWLALLALLIYLADIVYRRWPRANP